MHQMQDHYAAAARPRRAHSRAGSDRNHSLGWRLSAALTTLACVAVAAFSQQHASTDAATPAPSAKPAAELLQAQYHLVTRPAQRIEATLTDTFTIPDIYAKEWTIYAPDAPDTDDQKSVFSTLEVTNREAHVATWSELSPLSRTLLHARLFDSGSVRGAQLSTKTTFTGILYRRELVPGPATEPTEAISEDDRQKYTRASVTIDYDAPAFQSWLMSNGLRKQATEHDLNYALRIFDYIRDSYKYAYILDQDREASAICQTTATDCGGLSQLFVAALRSAGIPAMVLCGRIARSADGAGDHGNCHVKAQFYASGVGWVPVEMSGATYDKSAPYWVYFGRNYGDFLTLSVDNDQRLEAGPYGVQNQRGLQGVRFWVWGSEGSDDHVVSSSAWTVRRLPLNTYGNRLADAKD